MTGETIGQLIRRLRVERMWSRTCLAQQLADDEDFLDTATIAARIGSWERGESIPDIHWLRLLAQVLKVNFSELQAARDRRRFVSVSPNCPHLVGHRRPGCGPGCGRGYPPELRDEVVAAYLAGPGGLALVARRFGVSKATVRRWVIAAEVTDGRQG